MDYKIRKLNLVRQQKPPINNTVGLGLQNWKNNANKNCSKTHYNKLLQMFSAKKCDNNVD